MSKWISPYPGCHQLHTDWGRISYVERGQNPVDELLVLLGGMKRENLGRSETALMVEEAGTGINDVRYMILYGDHRKEYEALIPQRLDACIDYFNRNVHLTTDTSNQPKATRN